MANYTPERTIPYKTFVKTSIVNGLNAVFQNHVDKQLQRTKVTLQSPRTNAQYPAVVIRFFERDIKNIGVGHVQYIKVHEESVASAELGVSTRPGSSVQLSWPRVPTASSYRVYRGTTTGQQFEYYTVQANSFTDQGAFTTSAAQPLDTSDSTLTTPNRPVGSAGSGLILHNGSYFYRVSAITGSHAWKFKHYLYDGDIEVAIYALSPYDRDLISDAIVQTITMGDLEVYTSRFFDEIYPPTITRDEQNLHFINVNSDQLQGFGESEMATEWEEEDAKVFQTSYRFGILGELFSLPPGAPLPFIKRVIQESYIKGVEPVPPGDPTNSSPWET